MLQNLLVQGFVVNRYWLDLPLSISLDIFCRVTEAVHSELGGVKLPTSLKPRVIGLSLLARKMFIFLNVFLFGKTLEVSGTSILNLSFFFFSFDLCEISTLDFHGEAPRLNRGFLSPVVFIPFVEVTLTAEQEMGPDKEDLVQMLQRWGKMLGTHIS